MIKLKHLLLIIFLLLFNKWSNAQCVLKKITLNGITTTETAETYIYNRHAKQYNAIAVTAFTEQTPAATKTFLKLNYTATNHLQQPKFLYIQLINGETVAASLKFITNNRSDNGEQLTKTYQVELNAGLIDKLNLTAARSVGMLSSGKTTLAEIMVTDGSMFQQLLNCFKDLRSK